MDEGRWGNIGALIIRIALYAIILTIMRNPQIVLVIMKAPLAIPSEEFL